MTLTIEVEPEIEAKLHELAQSYGQSLEIYVRDVLEREIELEAEEDAQDIAAAKRALATSDPAQRKTLDDLRAHIAAQRDLAHQEAA